MLTCPILSFLSFDSPFGIEGVKRRQVGTLVLGLRGGTDAEGSRMKDWRRGKEGKQEEKET